MGHLTQAVYRDFKPFHDIEQRSKSCSSFPFSSYKFSSLFVPSFFPVLFSCRFLPMKRRKRSGVVHVLSSHDDEQDMTPLLYFSAACTTFIYVLAPRTEKIGMDFLLFFLWTFIVSITRCFIIISSFIQKAGENEERQTRRQRRKG